MLTYLIFGIVGLLIVSTMLVLYVLGLRRIVPTNEVHIVQRNQHTVEYGKGMKAGNVYYQIPAWIPKFGVVVSKLPSTIIDVTLNRYEAYDKERLPFVVEIKAFFRIQDFAVAASRVFTVNELKEQLTAIVQGAARSILAKEYLEDIMSKRSEYGQSFTKEVASQLVEWGVVAVKNIELMDIKDSDHEEVIANIMMKKKSAIEMERRVEVAKNLRTAQESEILAKQEIQLKQQDADREVGLRRALVEKEVGIANQKQEQEVQAEAKITAEKEMDVKRVREIQAAEIEKQAAEVKANQDKEVTAVNAEALVIKTKAQKEQTVLTASAEKEKIELNAQAQKTQIELKAAADLIAATNEAKGIEAKGKSNASARDLMEKAEVAGQIELFNKVNKDQQYQEFLVKQRQVEAMEKIGIEQAKALINAKVQVYATGGNAVDGLSNASKLVSPQSGLNLSSMLETITATPAGKELVDGVIEKLSKKKEQ